MFPLTFQTPAAVLLVAAGLVSCFIGYRFFRTVLVVYGLVLGGWVATSFVAGGTTTQLIVAGVAGALLGALLLYAAYFVAVALVGAALGAFLVDAVWTEMGQEPQVAVVILFAVAGAVAAMLLQRYVIIVATAFGGAWMLIVGGLALAGNDGPMQAALDGNVWLVYPFSANQEDQWILILWFVLGVLGALLQLGVTGKGKKDKGKSKKKD